MSSAWLSLSPAGLVAGCGGEITIDAPACALLGPAGEARGAAAPILFGADARAASKRYPDRVRRDFWQRVFTPRGQGDEAEFRLAQAQLRDLEAPLRALSANEGGLVVALPLRHVGDHLAALLGVLEGAGVMAAAVVDGAAAQAAWQLDAAETAQAQRIAVVELLPRQLLLTPVHLVDGTFRSEPPTTLPWGEDRILDQLLLRIAAAFIESHRHDPLHTAATEQALLDQLLEACAMHPSGAEAATARLNFTADGFSVGLDTAHLAQTTATRVGDALQAEQALAERRFDRVLVAHAAARIPGFLAVTDRLLGPATALPAAAPGLAIEALHEALPRREGDAVPLVRSLRRSEQAAPRSAGEPPTHVLDGGHALALAAAQDVLAGCRISVAENGAATVTPTPGGAVTLNDRPLAQPTPLYAGDVLSAGGKALHCIRVSHG
jgi:hypothetical protein